MGNWRILTCKLAYDLRATRMSRAALVTYQGRHLHRLVQFATAHSPLFARRYGRLTDGWSLEDLEPIRKRDVLEHFDAWSTDRRLGRAVCERLLIEASARPERLAFGRYLLFNTSGTTGERLIIAYDRLAFDRTVSAGSRRPFPLWSNRTGGVRGFTAFLRPLRVATLTFTGSPVPSYLSMSTVFRRATPFVKSRFLDCNTDPRVIATKLAAFAPDILIGYASSLQELAVLQLAGACRIRLGSPFSRILSICETLSPMARHVIEAAFRVPVYNLYGSGECLLIANPCPRSDALHINEDICILQNVDDHCRPVPDGQLGAKILITNLLNYTHPFIRYEIDDSLIVSSTPCSCGSPFRTIIEVRGRAETLFRFTSPDGREAAVNSLWFSEVLVNYPGIRTFQVVQSTPRCLTVRVVPERSSPFSTHALLDTILSKFQGRGCEVLPPIEVRVVGTLDRHPTSGKVEQFLPLNFIGSATDDQKILKCAG